MPLTPNSANATVLFPKVVKVKRTKVFRWGQASTNVLFEIAIISFNDASGAQAIAEAAAPTTKYQALLTHGLMQKQKTAAVGDVAVNVYAALESLLAVTANELAVRKSKAFEEIPASKMVRSAGGIVDGSLFQDVGLMGKVKRAKL